MRNIRKTAESYKSAFLNNRKPKITHYMERMQQLVSLILAGLLIQCVVALGANAQNENRSVASIYSYLDEDSSQNYEVPVKDLLNDIEQRYQMRFLFHDRIMEDKYVNIREISMNGFTGEQLAEILTGLDLNYSKLDEQTLVITERKPKPVQFQEETVTGRVVDADTGEPLPNVNILIVGTDSGTVTDLDGFYTLNVPELTMTLRFSFIGYQSTTVDLEGRTEINVELEMEQVMGQELVVTGYGTVRERETVSGSVSAVSGERLEAVPTSNLSNTLAGRVSGLSGVNVGGEPGEDDSTIRIRGNATLGENDPLVVIDGVPARQGGLSRINPHDIENVSILKDASAAIYGSRAANGVILITTKRGRSGAPQLTVNATSGVNQPTVIPNMANSPTYLTMLNEIDMYRGESPRRSQEEIDRYRNIEDQDPWLYHDTDWFSEGLKRFSYESEASVSLSGGTESVRYRISARGLTEDAYYRDSATRYNQGELRSNLDIDINDHIRLGADLAGRFEDRNFPTQSAGAQFRFLMRGKPHEPAFWPDGSPGPDIENGTNPVVSATPATGHHNIDDWYLQSSVYLNLEIPQVEGLSFRGNFSYDRHFHENELWATPWILNTWDGSRDSEGNPVLSPGQRGPGTPELTRSRTNQHDITFNLVGNFQRNFEDHNFGIMAGTERETFRGQSLGAYREGFISPEFPQLDLGAAENRNNWGNSWHGARQNYFSRINYDFRQTYLLEVVGRMDGSYIFPEGDRYGFFPSASVGWRLSNESWFQGMSANIFDDFTIRTSYGRTGNDQVDPYQFLGTYSFGGGYIFNETSIQSTLREARIPNPNITWEVANQFNVGLDFTFWNSRLQFEIDYFDYNREGILWQRDAALPLMAGFQLPDENIGEVRSYGLDATMNYLHGISEDLFLSATLTVSYADNEILFFDEPDGIPEWQRNEGMPMNTNLYFNVIGVFQDEEEIANTPSWDGAQPGDLIFEDVNGDGKIDANDRIRDDRTAFPKWTGGIELGVTYKNWDISTFWQGAAGAVVYTQTESGEIGNFRQSFAENRWTPDNPSDTHPRTWNRSDEYWASNQNTYFLESTDYIRLKTLEVSYSLPASLTSSLGLQRARVSLSGFNLLTFTGLEDLDPEAAAGSGQYYPQRRSLRAGFSVTF
jgi:TonB-dependent starch-binding outer membrane protein SusC